MVRVLHVFGKMDRGGAELRTVELVEILDRSRVQSDFLVLSAAQGSLDARIEGLASAIIRCPISLALPFVLIRTLRQGNYQVVHSHVLYFSGVVLAIAKIAGVPGRVAHFRTSGDDSSHSRTRSMQIAFCKFLMNLTATHILAVSEGAMAGAWSPTWRHDPRCRVIYNGVSSRRLSVPMRSHAVAEHTIVGVASIQPAKNQLRLISVFRHCLKQRPELKLLLIGRETPAYGMRVREAIADAGLARQVSLLGEVENPVEFMAKARLMILPSLREGLPGAALEASALGLPVLASELPGVLELAQFFPSIHTLSLQEPDEEWARLALQLIEAAPRSQLRGSEWLERSPFDIGRARERYYEVWAEASRAN